VCGPKERDNPGPPTSLDATPVAWLRTSRLDLIRVLIASRMTDHPDLDSVIAPIDVVARPQRITEGYQ
jgi:hypothetical protein